MQSGTGLHQLNQHITNLTAHTKTIFSLVCPNQFKPSFARFDLECPWMFDVAPHWTVDGGGPMRELFTQRYCAQTECAESQSLSLSSSVAESQ